MKFQTFNLITAKRAVILALPLLFAAAGVRGQADKNESPVKLSELAAKVKSSAVQIVDVRTPEEFSQNHLNGAININAATAGYEKDVAKLSKDETTLVYSIANGRSVSFAKELKAKGFKDVVVLPGGISNWIGSGYPIVNNSKKGVSLNLGQFNALTASSHLVLVDFGSRYCGSCRRLVPVLDSLEKQQGFAAKIVRIEAYDNTELLKELKVNRLPTLVLYRNNKEVWKKSGQSTTTQISNVISGL